MSNPNNAERSNQDTGQRVWGGEWRAKVRARLHAIGCETVEDLLTRHPAEPYLKLVKRLGDDVAALQVTVLQFEEAIEQGRFREAAKDRLARLINGHLKKGWGRGLHLDFNTAGVYADWATELEKFRPESRPLADAVWRALLTLPPPQGWTPTGPDDAIIKAAFEKGWPEQMPARISVVITPPVLCPRCNAVLRSWADGVQHQTCSHCGEQVSVR